MPAESDHLRLAPVDQGIPLTNRSQVGRAEASGISPCGSAVSAARWSMLSSNFAAAWRKKRIQEARLVWVERGEEP